MNQIEFGLSSVVSLIHYSMPGGFHIEVFIVIVRMKRPVWMLLGYCFSFADSQKVPIKCSRRLQKSARAHVVSV